MGAVQWRGILVATRISASTYGISWKDRIQRLTSVLRSKARSVNTACSLSNMSLPSAHSLSTTTASLCVISKRDPWVYGAVAGVASTARLLCPKGTTVPRNQPMATSLTEIWVHLLILTHWRSPSLFSLPRQTNIWVGFLTPNFRNSLYYLICTHLRMDYSPQAPSINDRKKQTCRVFDFHYLHVAE